MTIAETFDEHWIAVPGPLDTPCHVWQRARKGKEAAAGGGYGCFTVKQKSIAAHKFAYERKHGAVPDGLHVMHRCHNTLCVNDDHLEVGTNTQNQCDRAKAGRYTQAKLTPDDVRAIRAACAAGQLQREVAARYKLQQGDVSHIVRRHYWAHVE